jgi:hypothetical protein
LKYDTAFANWTPENTIASVNALAVSLGIDAGDITVTSVIAGSVIVNFTITFPTPEAAAAAVEILTAPTFTGIPVEVTDLTTGVSSTINGVFTIIPPPKKKLSTVAIIGIAVGSAAVATGIIVGIVYGVKRAKKNKQIALDK